MRSRLASPAIAVMLLATVLSGCGGGDESAEPKPQKNTPLQTTSTAPTSPSTFPATTIAPTTTRPPAPNTVPATGPTAVSIPASVPIGQRCMWLAESGYSFAEAAVTFDALGLPADMDADNDGIPCETRYNPDVDDQTVSPGPSRRFPIQPSDSASWPESNAHGYPATDVYADCGTTVVAMADGLISEISHEDRWDPAIDDPATKAGLSVAIEGDDGVRYYGSHMQSISNQIWEGGRISAGDVLGTVGHSGNARDTPCHLHVGLSPSCQPGTWDVRRGTIDPRSFLEAWQEGADASPASDAAAQC